MSASLLGRRHLVNVYGVKACCGLIRVVVRVLAAALRSSTISSC